ncbi:MAG: glycosyl hydrolase family 32 domain protein, partial [Spirochaetales bacterium]|nr:glycosyl hydrolase family 32 domain protein [Spirochaetales bacterium]
MSTNPEFESKVPKFRFSETLDEQKKELAENPLLKRMLAVRSKMADDPHRPIY